MRLSVHTEQWPLATPFRITGKVFDTYDLVVVQIEHYGMWVPVPEWACSTWATRRLP
jgi:hypothetical protein